MRHPDPLGYQICSLFWIWLAQNVLPTQETAVSALPLVRSLAGFVTTVAFETT